MGSQKLYLLKDQGAIFICPDGKAQIAIGSTKLRVSQCFAKIAMATTKLAVTQTCLSLVWRQGRAQPTPLT